MSKITIGKCKICLEEKELSFEHIPPSSANNKTTRYYEIPQAEYFKHAREYVFLNKRPKARLLQGGLGGYFLCRDCNNFLGSKYVRDFTSLSRQCESALRGAPSFVKAFEIPINNVNLFRVLKQMAAIFICCNDDFFTKEYPEILEFVRNEEEEFLPPRYRFYMYLNNEGTFRSGKWMAVLNYGCVCEFTFPPLGFVLSIDSPTQINNLYEITAFSQLKKIPAGTAALLHLNKLPTYYPFPLDYRSAEELKGSP
jgi:hypothetical protein